MKGGITVTMEDLQCLDSGKYLNDVIIDFYLKYELLFFLFIKQKALTDSESRHRDASKLIVFDFCVFKTRYLLQNASASVVERSHIFSSFFYKQLTRRDNASEGGNSDS